MNDWKDSPGLAGLDKNKLDMLQSLASQGAGKSSSELMQFLLSAQTQGKNSGMNFSDQEVSAVIQALKAGKSPQEASRIDRIANLVKMMRH